MCILRQIFFILGLFLDLIGAYILASGLFVNKTKILELLVVYKGLPSENDEENLNSAFAKHFLTQSKKAKIGVTIICLGFSLQIIGNILSLT